MAVFTAGALLIVFAVGAGTLTAAVALARRCLREREQAAALIANASTVPSRPKRVLILGPAQTGKSTLMRQAVALWEEDDAERRISLEELEAGSYQPTGGLVMRTLALPTGGGMRTHVQMCDAPGAAPLRRLWTTLIRDAEVCALIFVANVADGSEETLSLFAQLAHAPWARDSQLLVALSHADVPSAHDAAVREAQYRAAARETFLGSGTTARGQALSCHALNCRDADPARRVLLLAAAACVRSEG